MAARRLRGRGEALAFAGLTVFGLAVTAAIYLAPHLAPIALLTVPMVLGSLVLRPTVLPWYLLVLIVPFGLSLLGPSHDVQESAIPVLTVLLIAALLVTIARRRSNLGVTGHRAEAMLTELRERIQRQGGMPQLPLCWRMQHALRTAEGSPFAGDFVVATRRGGCDHLEFCLVDVSGKGNDVGARALQLSGAMGGILGSLPPAAMLSATNDWVLEQEWHEGFATGVHVCVDLATGDYEVRSAGHPPVVVRAGGSGRWTALDASGPALGLLEDPEYDASRGRLLPGDVMVVCTDGVVENSTRDVTHGVDRLTGVAEDVLRGDRTRAAERVMDKVAVDGDDRALVILFRVPLGAA